MRKKRCCDDKFVGKQLSNTVEFLKVIAEENRLKILCILLDKEQCVCDIWKSLELPQNLTSHHLKILRDFDLLTSRKEGLNVFYSVNKNVLFRFKDLLDKFLLHKEMNY